MLFLVFHPWVMGAPQISFGAVEFNDVWPTGGLLGSIFTVDFLKILPNLLRAFMWHTAISELIALG